MYFFVLVLLFHNFSIYKATMPFDLIPFHFLSSRNFVLIQSVLVYFFCIFALFFLFFCVWKVVVLTCLACFLVSLTHQNSVD